MIDQDDFYVGYQSGLSSGLRRVVVPAVITAITGSVILAALFVSQQRPLADARFEFGVTRAFSGYLVLSPAPALLTADRDATHVSWLVARGKSGAAAALGGMQPGWITLTGSLIEREQWRMIEVVSGSVQRQQNQPPALSLTGASSQPVELTGEIVDGKCYLGVMNPGERTVHRDCAVRCLDGGVPAMFAYRDPSGAHLALLLGADAASRANGVGRPVRLSGTLWGPEHARIFSLGTAQ